MKGSKAVSGKDRDEYPPAMFKEGGNGASVRPIAPPDNRGAGKCIGAQCRDLPGIELYGAQGLALAALLGAKNGFYAFESVLHLFPARGAGVHLGVAEWNAADLWRGHYQGMADDYLFFAEDIFGAQFCLHADGVGGFDPETGDFELFAPDLEGWAGQVLGDYEVMTGYPLAHSWQEAHGPLPKLPFVTGGDFTLANLYPLDAVKGMCLRAGIAVQIRDLPDHAAVTYVVE